MHKRAKLNEQTHQPRVVVPGVVPRGRLEAASRLVNAPVSLVQQPQRHPRRRVLRVHAHRAVEERQRLRHYKRKRSIQIEAQTSPTNALKLGAKKEKRKEGTVHTKSLLPHGGKGYVDVCRRVDVLLPGKKLPETIRVQHLYPTAFVGTMLDNDRHNDTADFPHATKQTRPFSRFPTLPSTQLDQERAKCKAICPESSDCTLTAAVYMLQENTITLAWFPLCSSITANACKR